jgi:hypothetical protein
VITHQATQCNVVQRPGDISEEGLDDQNRFWMPEWEYQCEYKMHSIANKVESEVDK